MGAFEKTIEQSTENATAGETIPYLQLRIHDTKQSIQGNTVTVSEALWRSGNNY